MSAPAVGDIRGLCLDVDGVLTDGTIYMDDRGRGLRAFHVHDGFAMSWFQKLVGPIIICSGKSSPAVDARMHELAIPHVLQGSRDKLVDVERHLKPLKITVGQLAVIGDDLPDVNLMRHCGFPIAVANAVDEVKAIAKWVTPRSGGQGAVRDAIEHLLKALGHWPTLLAKFDVPGLSESKKELHERSA